MFLSILSLHHIHTFYPPLPLLSYLPTCQPRYKILPFDSLLSILDYCLHLFLIPSSLLIYLSNYLTFYVSMYLCIYLYCLSCLPIYLSIYLYIYQSVYLSLYMSILLTYFLPIFVLYYSISFLRSPVLINFISSLFLLSFFRLFFSLSSSFSIFPYILPIFLLSLLSSLPSNEGN